MVLRDVHEIMWCDFLLASVMLQIVANDFLMVLRGAHEIDKYLGDYDRG